MTDRRDELKRAVRPRRPTGPKVARGRTTGPPQKQSYPKGDPRFRATTDMRREELIRTLGVRNLKPGEKVDLLHRGKVVGPPWLGGIFQTRLNWGTLVLAFGFILFIVWLILAKTEMGG